MGSIKLRGQLKTQFNRLRKWLRTKSKTFRSKSPYWRMRNPWKNWKSEDLWFPRIAALLVYLKEKIRNIFNLGRSDCKVFWIDEDNDHVAIETDEELVIALQE